MKRNTKKITSILVCVMMLCAMLAPMAVAAELPAVGTRTGSIEIDIPVEDLESTPIAISPMLVNTYKSGGLVNLNAYFNKGETLTVSNWAGFDCRDNSIPVDAAITSIQVTLKCTSVSLVTYYVDVGYYLSAGQAAWCEAIRVPSGTVTTVTTNEFNGYDPWGYWYVAFIAERLISNPSTDIGAAASASTVSIKINYRYN